MKTRFNSFDILCSVTELQKLIGMRVNNIYDIDNKTYLIKLQRTEEKSVLLLESGNRIHTTNFEWPKNIAPSGFSMKLRKHLKNKRLEKLTQIGLDRIVILQFGTGEAAYHVILELYDRGNILLTDYEMTILNVLRPHTEGDKVKFAVREKYPENRGRESNISNVDDLRLVLDKGKVGDPIKKVLMMNLDYGPSLIEHVLLKSGFANSTKLGKSFEINTDIERLFSAIEEAKQIVEVAKTQNCKGFLIQKREEKPTTDPNAPKEYLYSNQEFHPMLYSQHISEPYQEFDTFNLAVDEFYSTFESQKIELRGLQQEKEALKKLDNIKKDHDHRLTELEKAQETDKQKAELITRNQELVDNAILAIQSALASQISWMDIENLVKDATAKGDPVAKHIKHLKLDTNHISLYLTDPYNDESGGEIEGLPSAIIDIDLALSAFANARNYYDKKRFAAKKQQKTLESQGKALKSAEKKAKETLKEVKTITNIHKARKVYWFEKFFWFISSENYLVIGGRDQQQNELIVKRYMKPKDVYVHADIHGASSIVIKNPSGLPVPPKTLNEAGIMAICYSVAWEAKVITNAYWVYGEQVSKTAPTGEYLTTGSFMIRDKKNFLPPSHLILGLSFLFRVEDSHIEKHIGERKPALGGDDTVSIADSEQSKDEVELEIIDESDEDEKIAESDRIESVEEENRINQDSSDSESSVSKFPDTHIKIEHSEGTKINIIAEPVHIKVDPNTQLEIEKPAKLNTKTQPKKSRPTKKTRDNEEIVEKEQNDENVKFAPIKRGQKSKLKKIKEKYKDQDDEERKLRMEILQSAGSGKDTKKGKKSKEAIPIKNTKIPRVPKVTAPKSENVEEGDEEESGAQVEIDMINTLTGQPFVEDELLFAVPIIAPYNALNNYKFKVKLTPGTGRRGKAARTAVNMFLKDRAASQREKDLLKAVKDEQLARNLPGKVKLSAPRLQVYKK
ncbi:hypothetical protein PPYR_00503 [Photinus pyralis]|uniref:NFACT RNA-binding domain-containing protein n=1 Tax=Photinus pyralis TaxID=7054 RepID=A0A1Y1N191_PHOPY|nr:nuclear export mediator factor NEMF homolog [Photinus pyralis]KAB0803533.1 hypothetical protein PPYR_00503 [Photinus pyralis]